MNQVFVRELVDAHKALLENLSDPRDPAQAASEAGITDLLRVALVNEIAASELASAWMPSTPEIEVKIALARQAGDEAGHFQLVQERLRAHGVSLADFTTPPPNPLFEYLRGLEGTVERLAAGLVALESIAYRVNDRFLRWAEAHGDKETARVYRDIIQPEELRHHRTGCERLARFARTGNDEARARRVSMRVLEIAAETRATAARKLGTSCFPGC